jgi:hypothetical protein
MKFLKTNLMNKKTFLLSVAVLFSAWSFSQSADFNQQIGVSLKASTNGVGADLYYRPTKKWAIKAGAEYLSFNLSSDRIESFIGQDPNVVIANPYGNDIVFNIEGNFKTGAISLAVGYQPFKLFYVTVGLGKSLFTSDVTGITATDIMFEGRDVPTIGMVNPIIYKDDIGPFIIDIDYKNSIIPYIGIGLGSFVPQNKLISFALEIGAYYVGNFALTHTMPTGITAANIDYGPNVTQELKDMFFDEINAEVTNLYNDVDKEVSIVIDDINNKLESYKFYPVLKLTIGFNAFTF